MTVMSINNRGCEGSRTGVFFVKFHSKFFVCHTLFKFKFFLLFFSIFVTSILLLFFIGSLVFKCVFFDFFSLCFLKCFKPQLSPKTILKKPPTS